MAKKLSKAVACQMRKGAKGGKKASEPMHAKGGMRLGSVTAKPPTYGGTPGKVD